MDAIPNAPADAQLNGDQLALRNGALLVKWDLRPGRLQLVEITNGTAVSTAWPQASEIFILTLAGGQRLPASQLRVTGKPKLEKLRPQNDSVRKAATYPGKKVSLSLTDDDGRTRATWSAVVRDGANYVRQELTIAAEGSELPLRDVQLLDLHLPDAKVIGSVDGSPVAAGNMFFACEHPMAKHRVEGDHAIYSVPRHQPLRVGQSWTVGSVIGVAPPGQLRRAFLHYVERERARPYSPFSYYISWFDIAAPDRKMDARQCLDVIEAFGSEMVTKRGVKLSAFVFDDGWDDNKTLWKFHPGFPNGFRPLRDAAAKFGARLGTWISPFGGYGAAKKERLSFGATQGFETNRAGFSLAGPKYYRRFRDVCAEMVRRHGVSYLKFDGIGGGSDNGPGKDFGLDLEAELRLIEDLRSIRRDLFFNTTVGTWPSPFWLWWSDSVWRGGEDIAYAGKSSKRQQWMTYRDALGYKIRTQRGPLYPLNSLKFQSVMYARLSLAAELSNDPKEVIDDIRMAAGSGTQMQEFFITPAMMTPPLWDALAEAVAFTQRNARALVDTHGIGGDPAAGEPYGYAAWSPDGGVLALRNPSCQPARFAVDLHAAFELPAGAPQSYTLRSPWKQDAVASPRTLKADQPHTFELAPFEVQVRQASPQ